LGSGRHMWADAALVNRASAARTPSLQPGCCRRRAKRANPERS
jgi:hypothetical protein